jgi:DNA-binding NarL/FixJ family response regulator
LFAVAAAAVGRIDQLVEPPKRNPPIELSLREVEILMLLSNGSRIEAVAERLHIIRDTVNEHLESARKKLGTKTTAQAIADAIRRRLME